MMIRNERTTLLAMFCAGLALAGCDGGAADCSCSVSGVELACGETRCVDGERYRCYDDGLGIDGTCGTPDGDAGPPMVGPLCSDECATAFDGECDDGGEGADFAVCALGTDCNDCGPREGTCTPSCSGRECGGDGCGGSCGTCSSGSCTSAGTCSTSTEGCEGGPRCEGDVAVSCEGSATIRETCIDRCEAGECVTDGPPAAVTITGSYGSATPIHSASASLVTLTASPSFDPELSTLPDLWDETPTSVSPSPGGCAPNFGFTLNRGEVSAQVTGDSACAGFVEQVASGGLEVTFDDAPFQSGGAGTIDVTLRLRP